MGLTLITGPANAGKTGLLHARLIEASANSQPTLLLPQQSDVRIAAREFAAKAVLGVRAATFDEWARERWRLHGDGRRVLGELTRTSILERAIERSGLRQLAASASRAGFPGFFGSLIARVPPERARPSSGVLGELSLLIDSYRDLAEREGLIEFSDALVSLAHADFPVEPIALNRFTDLSAGQESLISSVSRRTDVFLALTWSPGRRATEALDPLVARLMESGATVIEATESSWTDPGLSALEAALFEGGPTLEVPDSVSVGLTVGRDAECALVADEVRRTLDAGVPADAVAVVFRDVGSRAAPLMNALAARGVSAVSDISMPFGATRYGAAFGALLDVCAGRADPRERMLAFLHSPYSGVDADAASGMDARWRRARAERESIVASARAELPGARSAVSLAARLATMRVGSETVEEWQKLASELLANAHQRRGLDGFDGRMDAAAHRTVCSVLRELAEAEGETSEPSFMRTLRGASVTAGTAEGEAAVLVTEAHRLRGRRFDMLVIGGLTAGEFSSDRAAPLAVEVAARFGQRADADTTLAERLLFHTLVTRARQRLFLVRQVADDSGDAMRPSVFWEETLDVYRTADEAAAGMLPEGMRARRLSVADLARTAPAHTAGRIEARITLGPDDTPSSPKRGRLRQPEVLSSLMERDEYSVSEIEAYIACPYRWFHDRVLRPKELDVTVDARERGSLVHDMLRVFYDTWTDGGRSRVDADTVADALGLLDEVARRCRAEDGRTAVRGLAEELTHARAYRWAKGVIEDDVTFLPGFEVGPRELGFGSRHGRPVRFGGVSLTGAVDRVDVGPAGVVVTDYKSSDVHGVRSFGSRGLLQVPVYAAVVSEVLGLPVVGGVYRSFRTLAARGFWRPDVIDLGSRGSAKDAVDETGFSAVVQAAEDTVAQAVDGMRAGRIAPDPLSARACATCDAHLACGRAGARSS